jgi:glycosyltransferase involved in cell wall biosynthesis
MEPASEAVRVSVVVPVRNEAGNVAPLVAEIEAAFSEREAYEVIFVDDGSTDATRQALSALTADRPWLRSLWHDSSCGQSCAIRTGVRAAQGAIIVTLDGDGQNDPAYIPQFVAAIERAGASVGLVAGQRLGRKDTGFKRWQSRIANAVRSRLLKDGTRDTGCGLKAIRREVYLALPYFDALHRFMPALVKREGYGVAYVDVFDRPRLSGQSNYGFLDRLWVGILDLLGVWWLIRRRRRVPAATQATEIVTDAR